jgi:tetratricopeptide (TPR) repeat protein
MGMGMRIDNDNFRRLGIIALLMLACDASAAPLVDSDEFVTQAQALTSSGDGQYTQRDFMAASVSYASAVDVMERNAGPLSLNLVAPLAGLGDALLATEQRAGAVAAWRRAVSIVRRSAGLYDVRQYAILEKLVDTQSLMGRYEDALADLRYMDRISRSAYAQREPERAATMSEVAEWYCRVGDFMVARERYRELIRGLEQRVGPNDASLLTPLTGLARCSFFELAQQGIMTTPGALELFRGPFDRTSHMDTISVTFRYHVSKVLRAEGEDAIRRAARLVMTAPVSDDVKFATLLQAGDWFLIKDHSRTAARYYERAARFAAERKLATDLLEAPVPVLYPMPLFAVRNRVSNAVDTGDRFVEVEFTAHSDGHVDGERIVDRAATKSMADDTIQSISVARFRPRLTNGELVDTEGVRYRQGLR